MSKAKRSPLKTVRVALKERSYPVCVGSGAIYQLGKLLSGKRSKRAFIIADQDLRIARNSLLESLKEAKWETHEIAVPAGEGLKDFKTLYPLYGELLNAKANRDSTLIALGGGSVGDAAGFLASTYLRGIDWVGVPTTLLAQVDSALGGKTAINHSAGKNLIGTFHQPKGVICDTDLLETLGKRELISGLGEVVKYGLIYDPKFLKTLDQDFDHLLARDNAALTHAIEKSVLWKAKVVAKDEFDRKGLREALNFGHTFGHAIEAITSYATYQHGEAVIWGMRFALALSEVRRKIAAKKAASLYLILKRFEVPPLPHALSIEDVLERMKQDKKVRNGKIHFVLLKDVGKTVSDSSVTPEDLSRALELLKGRSA